MPRKKRKQTRLIQTAGQAQRFTPTELEIMKRKLENESNESIARNLGMDLVQLETLLATQRFGNELSLQADLADREIRGRFENLASEALDVVRSIMRDAASPSYRLRAALELLDRSGYVKIEKRLTLTADAESVIKALNQQTQPAQLEAPLEAEEVDEFELAAREAYEETQ